MDNQNCFQRSNYNNKWGNNTEGNQKCYKYINSNIYNIPIIVIGIIALIYFTNK
jgi:hypothetical protein